MNIKVSNLKAEKISCDFLIYGIYEGDKNRFESFIRHDKFEAKKGETLVVHTQGKLLASKICFLGLGKKEDSSIDRVRNSLANASRQALKYKAETVSVEISQANILLEDLSQAVAEGLILGSYKFLGYHKETDPEEKIENVIFLVEGKDKMKAALSGLKVGEILAKCENKARDLVNAPSNKITPEYMADYAKKMAKENKLKIEILDPKKEKMEALWAIAKGSIMEPKVVVLWHKGGAAKDPLIALIGKGITFDSGGISIKPSMKMWEMKTDMAGAAAVIEAMRAISALKIKKNIVAVIPICENMPDAGALKPGDVVGSLDGTTIEIISTDAEGRIILADAITYAKNIGADKIFDCATLTGGCVTALGDIASGLLGNDQEFIDEIIEAAERSGQKMWHLPLYEEYEDYLKSNIADIKNCMDKGMASASTGGTFLKKFVKDTPWVHIDIAGTAYLPKTKGVIVEGGTGVPMRTILEWLRK